MAHPKFDFSDLTPDERIQLAEDLWDSLSADASTVPLTEPQARELDRRLEAYRPASFPPSHASSWTCRHLSFFASF